MKKWIIGLVCGVVGVTAAMGQLVISQYVETETGTVPKGIEVWNPTGSDITFDAGSNLLDVKIGVNGAAPASSVTVNSGTLVAGDVLVIGTADMAPDVEKTFNFNGDDAIVLELGGVVQDVIGTPGVDPGTQWSGGGVSTMNQNIQLLGGITTGDTDGWTDPSTRFETVSTTPSTDLTGFGIAPGGSVEFSVSLDKANGFEVEEGTSDSITATAANGTEPYSYAWTTDLDGAHYTDIDNVFTILDTAPVGDYTAAVEVTDDTAATASNSVTFSVVVPAVKYAITITPPVNGAVTTTPADEAEESQTVTINATGDSGYAVDTITVVDEGMNPVAVTLPARTFTMPASAVTVEVTFQESSASGELIISQYYEGTANNKWIEIYNPGGTAVDLLAGGYRLAQFSNTNREAWKIDGSANLTLALSGTIAAGGTYLVAHGSATNPAYATADQTVSLVHNGDDTTLLYTGESYSFANVVDAFGWTATSGAADKSYVRKDTVTVGVNTDFNAADWDEVTLAAVEAAGALVNERIGYHSTGPAVFGVTLNRANGFTVEEGTSDAITATAANGVEPYGYAWTTDLDGVHYTDIDNVFTILATAPVGDYYASVVATDDTAATASNSVTFSVAAPAPKYAITITPPVNGAVTTTPADEAEEGQLVTINATPDGGYAVDTITVVDEGMNPVAVTLPARTFTMPASAVTVEVTFSVISAEGIADFRFNDAPFLQVTANDVNLAVSDMALSAGTIETGITTGTYFTDEPYIEETGGWAVDNQAGAKAFLFTITPAEGASMTIDGISFKAYATSAGPSAFGFDIGGGMATYEVNAPDAALLSVSQAVVGVVSQTGAIVVKVQGWANGSRTTTGAGVFRLDDVVIHGSVSTGPLEFSVSLNKSNGFTVEQGTQDAITATAVHGTEPYGYTWDTDMTPGDYSADDNVFTILSTAALGDYSATVTATDASDPVQTASNTVTFSVVTPPPKYAITIVTNAPANGTVTTDPATEAAEGVSVTVNAVPGDGFAVESIVVNGGAVAVTDGAFTMPAEPVTVTVNFMVYVAPDVLIDFETGTLPSSYVANTATLEDGKVWSTMRVVKGNLENDKKIDTLSARLYPQTGTNAILQQTEAYAEPISEISYWVASYGSDNMANVTLAVEVSSDGTNWEPVSTLTGAEDITATMTEHVVATVPANAVYVRFVATAEATSNKRINLDNIGFNMGPASFGVSLNKSNGFEVQEGQSDAIVATAANGTAPYTYGWDSTLGATHYTASGDTFTILATAPTGSYSATVTATDSSEPAQEAQRTVTFSVVGLPPGQPAVVISGSLTGTVGVRMELVVSVTNETATGWSAVSLKNPLGEEYYDWEYGNFPPIFAFTPNQAGNWTLSATAETASGPISNTVTLVISEGGGDEPPPIPAITFVAGTGFSFEVPAGHTVARVEGADAAVAGDAFTWTLLSSPTDYEVVGTQVTIKSAPQGRRLIRVVFNVTP